MRKLILYITLFLLAAVRPVAAATEQTNGCRSIFGGGTVCTQDGNLLLDKKLKNPATGQFMDQAEVTDPHFNPGQTVVFQLSLTNTSARPINDITITDVFPQYVSFAKGPGTFSNDTNTVTIPVKTLAGHQTTTMTIQGTVVQAANLPDTTGALCVVNQATAKQGRNTSSDNSQFCLQKTVQSAQPQAQRTNPPAPQQQAQPATPPVQAAPTVSTAPKTGPEILSLIGLIPAGGMGLYLRKKTTAK